MMRNAQCEGVTIYSLQQQQPSQCYSAIRNIIMLTICVFNWAMVDNWIYIIDKEENI